MALVFPGNCNNDGDRLEYLYRAEELLRLQHNVMGKWYTNGISQNEYDNGINYDNRGILVVVQLTPNTKLDYSYKSQLTEEEFRTYQAKVERQQNSVIEEILKYKQKTRETSIWSIDIDEIPEFGVKS